MMRPSRKPSGIARRSTTAERAHGRRVELAVQRHGQGPVKAFLTRYGPEAIGALLRHASIAEAEAEMQKKAGKR